MDMLAEFGFSWLRMAGLGLIFYVVPRMAMLASVVLLYIVLPEGEVATIFPFWFRVMHCGVYFVAILFEFVSGVADVWQIKPTAVNSAQKLLRGRVRLLKSEATPSVSFTNTADSTHNKRLVFRRISVGQKNK